MVKIHTDSLKPIVIDTKNTVIDFNLVSFRYPGEDMALFKHISFSIREGERVVLSGPSGSGKSTLLYLMNRLYPSSCDGELEGSIRLWDREASSYRPGEANSRIATVFQDPDTQFCMPTVEQEMAFTLENLHIPRQEMKSRITETLEMTGLSHLRNINIQTLSGGMKQRIATACAILMHPKVLLLDEPLSHLDPFTAKEYVHWLTTLQLSDALTIIAVEHRLDLWGTFFDRAIEVQPSGRLPVEINPGRSAIVFPKRASAILDEVALEISGLSVNINGKQLLNDISFRLNKGEVAVLAGPNGSGKSTLMKTICGIIRSSAGTIKPTNRCPGYVPQSPEHLFVTRRVDDEIRFSNRTDPFAVKDIMERLRLDEIKESHPFSISHGQKRRVAIGAMLADDRPVLLLDEPTSGQDKAALMELFHLIDERAKDGFAVLIITHDMAFAASISDTVFLLKNGKLTGKFDSSSIWQDEELLAAHRLLRPDGEFRHA